MGSGQAVSAGRGPHGDAYARAGVDIDAGNRAVQRYRDVTAGWTHPDQLGSLGGFSGLFRLPGDRKRALVGSTDGVGTKILIAAALRRYDSVGADLVNHCVNDILVTGADPLFFLDYLAVGKLDPEIAAEIVARRAARLPRERLRAARRRDRRDAGRLSARSLRSGRNDRRHGRGRCDSRSEPRYPGRCDRRACRRSDCTRTATRSRATLIAEDEYATPFERRDVRRRAARPASLVSRSRCARSAASPTSRRWRTSPAAACWKTCRARCPRMQGDLRADALGVPPIMARTRAARRSRARRALPHVQHGHRLHADRAVHRRRQSARRGAGRARGRLRAAARGRRSARRRAPVRAADAAMAVNLLARAGRRAVRAGALVRAHDAAARAGYTLRRVEGADALLAAWIDLPLCAVVVVVRSSVPAAHGSPNATARSPVSLRSVRAGCGFPGCGGGASAPTWVCSVPTVSRRRIAGRASASRCWPRRLVSLRDAGYTAALIPAVAGERLIASYVARTGAAVVDEFDYGGGGAGIARRSSPPARGRTRATCWSALARARSRSTSAP